MAAAGARGVKALFEASTAARGRHPPVAPQEAMERVADMVKDGGDVTGSLHPKPERQVHLRPFLTIPPKKSFGPYEEIARLPGVVVIRRNSTKRYCFICRHCIVMRYSVDAINYHRMVWHGAPSIPSEEAWADVPNVPEKVPRYQPINKEEQAAQKGGGCFKEVAIPSTPPHLIRAVLLRTPPSGNKSSVGSPPSVVPESKEQVAKKLKNRPRRGKPFNSALSKLGSPSRSEVSKDSSGMSSSSDRRRECFMSRLTTLDEGCEINTDVVEMFAVAFGKLVVEDNTFHVATPWMWENFAERRQSVEAFRHWFARASWTLDSIRILLLPIHGRGHWSLLSLCMDWHAGDKPMFTALHFDSLEGFHEANLRVGSGARLICTRLLEAFGRTSNDLVFHYSKLNVPQQHNKVDCGAYTMFFIRECYTQCHNLQCVTGAGKELAIPSSDDISTVSRSYARSLLMMHWDFIDNEVPIAPDL